MKAGSGDRKWSIRITGAELVVLKECCLDLPESFGLDQRIEKYQGTRPIGFWPWDLDCLVDVLQMTLEQPQVKRVRPRGPRLNRKALQTLYDRLATLRTEAYADRNE